jgi:hypothetical protein
VFKINKHFISLAIKEGFPFSIVNVPSALEYKRKDIDIYSCSFNLHNKYKSATPEMKTALQEGVLKVSVIMFRNTDQFP